MGEFIRNARVEDSNTIARIYAEHVLTGTASFEVTPPSEEEMRSRIASIVKQDFPFGVFIRDNEILGYSYVAPYRTRYAYRFTVENSLYVDKSVVSCGIGTALLTWLIEECARRDYREIVAVIGDSDNKASIGLHQKCGFHHVGTLKRVGFKFERWLDSVIMQYPLEKKRLNG